MPEPTASPEPLPTAGGSYLRQPDGSLQRQPDPAPATEAAAPADAAPQDPQE